MCITWQLLHIVPNINAGLSIYICAYIVIIVITPLRMAYLAPSSTRTCTEKAASRPSCNQPTANDIVRTRSLNRSEENNSSCLINFVAL